MTPPGHGKSESLVAARNAVTLGASLAITGGIALLVRLLIPRFLGPGAFGELRLAESFAEMLFIVLTFGVDTQLRLDAALDASKARRYLGSLAVLRLGLGALGIAGTVVLLRTMGLDRQVVTLFVLIGLSQLFLVLNNSYAALEHAAGDVRWLARANFAAKALWAVLMVAVLLRWSSGLAIALAALTIEALRFGWFTLRAVRREELSLRLDLRLAVVAVMASFPIFVNAVAHNLYARIGIGWLASESGKFEVGLYGAASNIAAIALMGMPLLSWVLVPSTARAAAHSDEEGNQMVAGALRVSLLAGIPLAVALYLGAPLLLQALFGAEYLAAAPVLRIMAPTVGLAYISTVCAIALIQRGRTWTVAVISIAGVVVTTGLAATLIPLGARTLGTGGGAQGAAWAALATEVMATAVLAALSRAYWVERRLLRTAGALAGGVAAVALMLHAAPLPGISPAVAASVLFAGMVLAIGGLDRSDVRFCRVVLTRSPRPSSNLFSPELS